MARPESRYVCQGCGAATLRWEGQCRTCGAWNTLVETLVVPGTRRPDLVLRHSPLRGGTAPVSLADLQDMPLARLSSGISELDRVLGGGIVPGSLILLGGEPGIGKSTLVLEAAAGVARTAADDASGERAPSAGVILYASGEESGSQLRLRADRIGIAGSGAASAIRVLAETEVEAILGHAAELVPALLIVDSVQTVTVSGLEGPPGSVGQVREATARLVDFAKTSGVPVLLVGHVTKEGSIAGPKTLEHMVDVVLTLEGERSGPLRLLRASKDRFGSTDEVGVFEMGDSGLRELVDPARAFLGDPASGAAGVAVAATLEGSRPLLVEVQALVAPGGYGSPRRTVAGIDGSRLALLLAVLARRAGIGLAANDVYASVAGGLTIAEPALDLPLALALASSARDRPLAPATVACGEVGLLGELRPVGGLERRLREAVRLGSLRAVVPAGRAADEIASSAMAGLEIIAVSTLRAAIDAVLTAPATRRTSDAPVVASRAP